MHPGDAARSSGRKQSAGGTACRMNRQANSDRLRAASAQVTRFAREYGMPLLVAAEPDADGDDD